MRTIVGFKKKNLSCFYLKTGPPVLKRLFLSINMQMRMRSACCVSLNNVAALFWFQLDTRVIARISDDERVDFSLIRCKKLAKSKSFLIVSRRLECRYRFYFPPLANCRCPSAETTDKTTTTCGCSPDGCFLSFYVSVMAFYYIFTLGGNFKRPITTSALLIH